MVLSQQKRAVGLLSTLQDAELALNQLRESGFSIEQVGVISKEPGRMAHRGNSNMSAPTTMQTQGSTVTGTARGGMGNLLVGFGTLAIPGVGPAIEAGTGETILTSSLGDTGIGAMPDNWVGALVGIGIPEEHAHVYSHRASQGDCLVMLEGTAEQIEQAEPILNNLRIQEWNIYSTPETNSVHAAHSAV
jgi:hypothetical protein